MSNEHEHVNTEEVKENARAAIEKGNNIRDEVRDITLKALSEKHLDLKMINQVIHSVMEGVGIGAEAKGDQTKDALTDAMAGMDEALAKSAEASKLAIEETAGRIKDFSQHDLKLAVDNLQALEDLFFDTVLDVANGTNKMVKESLSDLIKHAQKSGTDVGKVSSEAVSSLNQKLSNTITDTVSASAHSTLEIGSHIASAAAGILEGIADTLRSDRKK